MLYASVAFKDRAVNDNRDGAMLQLYVVELRQPLMIFQSAAQVNRSLEL